MRALLLIAATMAAAAQLPPTACAQDATQQWMRENPKQHQAAQRPPEPRAAPGPPPAPPQEMGFYQAPPRTGSQQAPSGGYGIRGGTIVIPEIRFGLPRIEFPSIFRVRHPAKMVVNPAEAMWVSSGYRAAAVPDSSQRGWPEPAARSSAKDAPPNDELAELRRLYERKIEELHRQIQECEQLQRTMRSALEKLPQQRGP